MALAHDSGPDRARIRNPLVVFGLVLLAGDGPLVVAYALSEDRTAAWVLLVSIVLFVFSMAGVFCFLVICRPRHLFAPEEIPREAFGKSIYAEPKVHLRRREGVPSGDSLAFWGHARR